MIPIEQHKQEKHPLDVIEDVSEYAADGCSFDEIEARGGEDSPAEGDTIVEGMDVGLGGSLGTDNAFLDWVEAAIPADAVLPALEQLL